MHKNGKILIHQTVYIDFSSNGGITGKIFLFYFFLDFKE
jgi:hypothetical protein